MDENTNNSKNKNIKKSIFIIDSSVLVNMFNGDESKKSIEVMNKLKNANDLNQGLPALTTSASFFRALFLANPDVKIQNIQKVLSFITICPSFADIKDKEAVTKELLTFAESVNKNGYFNPGDKK
jgi:hypothetical protein